MTTTEKGKNLKDNRIEKKTTNKIKALQQF